jgi:Uma2 family endonuclease
MSDPKPSPDVYTQWLEVPPHRVAEIIRGGLVSHPRPAIPHASAASVLFGELFGPFRRGKGGPGGWIILVEPELHLGPDILVPDIAGWRREHLPELPDTATISQPPDWVCEVLSPGTAATDRADKLPIYAEHAIAHAWLVDPLARTLEVFKLHTQRWSLLGTHRDAARVRAEPFDAFELELAVLWEK